MADYAMCKACKKEMKPDTGCDYDLLVMEDSTIVPRIPNAEGTCHDCNAGTNQYHHPNCDMAICPICGGQESFCFCPIHTYANSKEG